MCIGIFLPVFQEETLLNFAEQSLGYSLHIGCRIGLSWFGGRCWVTLGFGVSYSVSSPYIRRIMARIEPRSLWSGVGLVDHLAFRMWIDSVGWMGALWPLAV